MVGKGELVASLENLFVCVSGLMGLLVTEPVSGRKEQLLRLHGILTMVRNEMK